jgi:dCTP deaminase
MMILTGNAIVDAINEGDIAIDPFDKKQLNPNSYNLRLSNQLLLYWLPDLDMKKNNKTFTIELNDKGFTLLPGVLYLGATQEVIASDRYVPIIDGRSSVGRLGINVHATAGYGDLGFKGTFTLELSVVQPVRIYPNVQIAQVRFQNVQGKIGKLYRGKYVGQTLPRASGLWKEFKKGKPK